MSRPWRGARRRGTTNAKTGFRLRAIALLEIAALAIMVGAALATPLMQNARAATYTIDVDYPDFTPDFLLIEVGDTVTWVSTDTLPHTVTSNNGSWAELDLPAGGSASHTFTAVGTYTYHCSLHPTMTGTVEVVTVIPEFSTMPLVVLSMLVVFLGVVAARRRR